MRSLLSATTSLPLQCSSRPGSIALEHAWRECAQHVNCRWPQSIAQGPRTQLQLSRSRDVMHASLHSHTVAAGLGCRFFFFFFGSADPRIFEDSNGSSADPDRSGFRRIRFTPTFQRYHACLGRKVSNAVGRPSKPLPRMCLDKHVESIFGKIFFLLLGLFRKKRRRVDCNRVSWLPPGEAGR